MNRSNDGDPVSESELQQFEDELRSLLPRAPRFALATDSTSLEERPKPWGRGGMVNRWTAAASLLLMWSIGAGMGATAALAWVGAVSPPNQSSGAGGPTDDMAVAALHRESSENLDSMVSAESANDVVKLSPEVSPVVSPVRATRPSFSQFVLSWRINRESQRGAQVLLSPIHVYRAASHHQMDSVASVQQFLTEVLGPVAAHNASRSSRAAPSGVVDYQPMLEQNQRELLRGLLGDQASRVF